MPGSCFHCGLPVPATHPPTVWVLGEIRQFCCKGCEAVCRAIVKADHEDYYRYREAPAQQADAEHLPAVLRQAQFYDHPDIQKGFVKTSAEWREAALMLEEIRCAACLWLNERHLRTLDGVLDVEMDYTSQQVRVRWDPERIKLSEILKALANIGYTAHPYDPAHRDALASQQKRRGVERIIFAGLIGMVVMQFSLAAYLMGHPDACGQYPLWVIIGRWTSLLAATAIVLYPGQEFLLGAWQDLKNRRLGMDVPIALGLLTAYGGSALATVTQTGEVYFDSIAMFVFLLLLARYAELGARLTAAKSLDRMTRVMPQTARRLDASGEVDVPLVELQAGDEVLVRPGETVPVDGSIVQGASNFSEALLTGEPMPVTRTAGQDVFAGSVNGDQPVTIRVSRRPQQSTVSQINRLVRRALHSRPRYTELAEHAAQWFVAVVLVIAAVTTAVWLRLDPASAIHNVVAVLIVTCPCALALATPVAVTLSAARCADLGLLPLRVSAIEPFAVARTVVFDKTGTLTLGEPRVCHIHCLDKLDEGRCLQIAASLEGASSHPFAEAFREANRAEMLAVEALRIHPSEGIEGQIDGRPWRVGTPEFCLVDHPLPAHRAHIEALRQAGHSVVVLSRDQVPVALFALKDPIRPGIGTLISGLKRRGIDRFVILSGDHPDSVARLAADLHIHEYHGGLSAQAKLDWLTQAQAEAKPVIMVGDGLNDAPALAAAEVSIALSEASDAAQVNSDFVLLGNTLSGMSEGRGLAVRTRRIVLQNLAWAAAYNLVALPVAAFGHIPPWGAAIGMSLSSLLVVGNSLRLRIRESRPTALHDPIRGFNPRFSQETNR